MMPEKSSGRDQEPLVAQLRAHIEALSKENDDLRAVCDQAVRHETDLLAMLEVLDGMVWSVDKDLRLRTMNQQLRMKMRERHGSEPRLGDLMMALMTGLDQGAAEAIEKNFAKALKGEKVSFLNDQLFSADGRHFEYAFNPILMGDQVIGVSCFALDVTTWTDTIRGLEAKERRFLALMEHSPDMLTIRDVESVVIYENPARNQVLGYPLDEGVGTQGFAAFHPDDLSATKAVFERALAEPGIPLRHAARLLRKDGSIVHTKGHMTNLLHIPEVGGVVSNIQDITDLVEANVRIEEDAARMAQVQQTYHFGSWEIALDLPDGGHPFLANHCSDEVFHILGARPGMAKASVKNFLKAVHPRDRTRAKRTFLKAVRSGNPFSLDLRLVRPDHSIRWVHAEGLTTTTLDEPEGRRMVGTLLDITSRKDAEAELDANEERFRAMIEGSTDGISLTDADMNIQYISPSALAIIGYAPEELMDKNVAMLMAEDQQLKLRELFERILTTPGKAERVQLQVHHKDGSQRWVSALLTNMLAVPAVRAVVSNFHDITNTINAQNQLAFDHANLKALINSTQDMLWSVDQDYRLITANESSISIFETALGFRINPGDSLRIPDVEGSSPTDLWYSRFQQAMTGKNFTVEEYTAHPHDTYLEMNYSPIWGMDSVVGVAVFARNITEVRKAQEELLRWNTLLEDRVVERTQELLLVNEELETETFRNKRLAAELATRAEEIMSSINYASRIQRSLIPTPEKFSFFQDMGLFLRPRDVVTGDFLWCHDNEERVVVAVGDCTGHGVPGAMMSMLGHDMLNRIVQENGEYGPDRILLAMDEAVNRFFLRADGRQMTDGMDIALIVIDKATKKLSFSGAGLPLVLIRNGVHEYRPGAKNTIGGHMLNGVKWFPIHTQQLQPGDRLCMYTDGYIDQFGGPNDKKFYRSNFVELMVDLSRPGEGGPLNATECIAALGEHFSHWKGTAPQVDDVLVLVLDV